jgi:hypothetical protein
VLSTEGFGIGGHFLGAGLAKLGDTARYMIDVKMAVYSVWKHSVTMKRETT